MVGKIKVALQEIKGIYVCIQRWVADSPFIPLKRNSLLTG